MPDVSGSLKVAQLPVVLPKFRIRQAVTTLNVLDGQTVVLEGLQDQNHVKDKELLVFVTATLVDPAGNPIHPDKAAPADFYDDAHPRNF